MPAPLTHKLVIRDREFDMSDQVKNRLFACRAIEELGGEDAGRWRLSPYYIFSPREVELLLYGDGG